jgi:hypothetical protein
LVLVVTEQLPSAAVTHLAVLDAPDPPPLAASAVPVDTEVTARSASIRKDPMPATSTNENDSSGRTACALGP